MITVDFSNETGEIRRLNGVNLAPRLSGAANRDYNTPFQRLNTPIARFHDAPLDNPGTRLVDINMIFANWHADALDPRNYYFKQTDDYLANCRDLGTDLHYRLGPSIEHSKEKYFIAAPDDYDKWIEVCEHIIRHYNEGWNDGFHWDIKYWTIIEEPENSRLWGGTPEQYYSLFKQTVKRLKERFPGIKLGTCIGNHLPEPWVSNYLAYCRDEDAPMDFFGYSCYKGDLNEVIGWPDKLRETLDDYGFTDTELHVAEWNYTNPEYGWSGPMADLDPTGSYGYDAAAFVAAVLIGWQDRPVAMANFYTASFVMGLLDKYAFPKKVYYGMVAFGEIARYQRRFAAAAEGGVMTLAGGDSEGGGAVLVSAFKSEERTLSVKVNGAATEGVKVRRVDQNLNLEPVDFQLESDVIVLGKNPGSAVFLIDGLKIKG